MVMIGIIIRINSRGSIFYVQNRVGRGNKDFLFYKFRTMVVGADKLGQLTSGKQDPRITFVGYHLRRYKLDELPQLYNIVKGDLSFVGPRAEVRRYVDYYNETEKKVLEVMPGLTDYAILEYNEKESKILTDNPSNFEEVYIKNILRDKLKLSLTYIDEQSFRTDLSILFKTIFKIISG